MATANISWTPVGGVFSLSQDVEYKAMNDVGWTLHSNVSASTNSAMISGLTDNIIYQVRITNHCPSGLTGVSTINEGIHITCPTVSVDATTNAVGYSFTDLGGDISSYTVELLNASDVVLEADDYPSPSGTISGTFSGLTPATNYKVRVTVIATGVNVPSFSQVCTSVPFTTDALVCNPPTAVEANMV